jgi:hypothetical protein
VDGVGVVGGCIEVLCVLWSGTQLPGCGCADSVLEYSVVNITARDNGRKLAICEGFEAVRLDVEAADALRALLVIRDDLLDSYDPDSDERELDVLRDIADVVAAVASPVVMVAGMFAVLVAGVCVWLLRADVRRTGSRVTGIWCSAAAVFAAYAGATYALASAPTVGANIGGGLAVVSAPFVAVVLLSVASLVSRRSTQQR